MMLLVSKWSFKVPATQRHQACCARSLACCFTN